MKAIVRVCFIIVLYILGISGGADAQGYLRASGTQIVNEKGENVLLRGIGLGGWMLQEGYMLRVPGEGQQHRIRERIEDLIGQEKTSAFYDQWLANHVRKIDIDSMKAWGFNSVRLPMHYNLYTPPIEQERNGSITWLEKGFAITDSLLSWCKANEMYLILDLHAAPGGQGTDANISDRSDKRPSLWDSEANQQKTVALWRKLAERYVDEPWIGGYDILNEPNWGFVDYENDKNGLQEPKNEPLKKLYLEITKAIREVDKKHIIIIEGNGWGNNYNGMLPPWDDNMVISFHKYWNYNDDNSISHILDTRKKYNTPVWLGETGENSNVWFTQAIALLERHNIGWAWWPLKKLGNNNPLQVPSNPGYEKILAYWGGNGEKPLPQKAEEALFRLANDLKLENNIYHHDVIDAMRRQPYTTETKPFRKYFLDKKTTIPAVDYDLGRNGYAYADMDTANYYVSNGPRGGNKGRVYRNDGVDIREDSIAAGTYYISDIERGEWWQYTVFVPKDGNFKVTLSLRPLREGYVVGLSVNDQKDKKKLLGRAKVSKAFIDSDIATVKLEKGLNKIRIYADSDGFELKSMTLTPVKR